MIFPIASFITAKKWKQPRCPSTGENGKINCAASIRYCLAIKGMKSIPQRG
jgi:hypothetical protein